MEGLRPFQWDDIARIVELAAACEEVDRDGGVPTEENLRHQFATPGIDVAQCLWTLPEADGRLAAMCGGVPLPGEEQDTVMVLLSVRPDRRTGSLERDLLRYVEARAQEQARQAGRCRVLSIGARADREREIGIYEEVGYQAVRWFLKLACDLEQPLQESPVPTGIRLRPLEPQADVEALYRIIFEAFQDHWNPSNFTQEQFAHWVTSPMFRPDLTLLAFAEDGEPAGACMNVLRDEYNARNGTREGYINTLGVRRPFRGQGLARALLTRSLLLLREAGMDTAVLDVDSANPTGATRLYESVGFRERKRSVVYHKPLPS